jgi:hypothetical protein
VLVVVPAARILPRQPAAHVNKWFAMPDMPIEVDEIALFATLADRDDLHGRYIGFGKHPDTSVRQ